MARWQWIFAPQNSILCLQFIDFTAPLNNDNKNECGMVTKDWLNIVNFSSVKKWLPCWKTSTTPPPPHPGWENETTVPPLHVQGRDVARPKLSVGHKSVNPGGGGRDGRRQQRTVYVTLSSLKKNKKILLSIFHHHHHLLLLNKFLVGQRNTRLPERVRRPCRVSREGGGGCS